MSRRQRALQREHGFTLMEMMTTILIMGIVFAIASTTWFDLIENRRVEGATNQMVSELRRAHSSATNRLENWQVDPIVNTDDYRIGPCDPCAAPLKPDSPSTQNRSLEQEEGEEGVERTLFKPPESVTRVVFEPNGDAEIIGSGNERIKVAAADGAPCHEIDINESTSRIRVIRNACDAV
jgi:prepilin-type N-terminal cleavage/methylation domain-containing protein